MKKIVTEVEGEGLESLLGEKVLVMCLSYFYWGTLAGVNDSDILLTDAHIVYETGAWDDSGFVDSQHVSESLYVRIDKIESYHKRS